VIDILVNNVGHRDRRGVLTPADLSRMLDVPDSYQFGAHPVWTT
jgi:hypothetical protein